jgi:tripartite-type tricarboxylate transporter receptor subunit TctC
MFADLGPALPLISAGKLRPIAVTTTARLAALPNVPPLAQAGVPGFDMAAWQGMIASAKTPPDIVAKLNTKLNTLGATADVRGRMRDLGMNPAPRRSPEELARFLQDEIVRWGKIVEAAGLAGSE